MIEVNMFRPLIEFKEEKNELHFIFRNEELSILVEGVKFHFTPIESNRIIVELNSMKIVNSLDFLVFQHKDLIKKTQVAQLLIISDIDGYLAKTVTDFSEKIKIRYRLECNLDGKSKKEILISKDFEMLFKELEYQNVLNHIDQALEMRNEELFFKLVNYL